MAPWCSAALLLAAVPCCRVRLFLCFFALFFPSGGVVPRFSGSSSRPSCGLRFLSQPRNESVPFQFCNRGLINSANAVSLRCLQTFVVWFRSCSPLVGPLVVRSFVALAPRPFVFFVLSFPSGGVVPRFSGSSSRPSCGLRFLFQPRNESVPFQFCNRGLINSANAVCLRCLQTFVVWFRSCSPLVGPLVVRSFVALAPRPFVFFVLSFPSGGVVPRFSGSSSRPSCGLRFLFQPRNESVPFQFCNRGLINSANAVCLRCLQTFVVWFRSCSPLVGPLVVRSFVALAPRLFVFFVLSFPSGGVVPRFSGSSSRPSCGLRLLFQPRNESVPFQFCNRGLINPFSARAFCLRCLQTFVVWSRSCPLLVGPLVGRSFLALALRFCVFWVLYFPFGGVVPRFSGSSSRPSCGLRFPFQPRNESVPFQFCSRGLINPFSARAVCSRCLQTFVAWFRSCSPLVGPLVGRSFLALALRFCVFWVWYFPSGGVVPRFSGSSSRPSCGLRSPFQPRNESVPFQFCSRGLINPFSARAVCSRCLQTFVAWFRSCPLLVGPLVGRSFLALALRFCVFWVWYFPFGGVVPRSSGPSSRPSCGLRFPLQPRNESVPFQFCSRGLINPFSARSWCGSGAVPCSLVPSSAGPSWPLPSAFVCFGSCIFPSVASCLVSLARRLDPRVVFGSLSSLAMRAYRFSSVAVASSTPFRPVQSVRGVCRRSWCGSGAVPCSLVPSSAGPSWPLSHVLSCFFSVFVAFGVLWLGAALVFAMILLFEALCSAFLYAVTSSSRFVPFLFGACAFSCFFFRCLGFLFSSARLLRCVCRAFSAALRTTLVSMSTSMSVARRLSARA